MYIESPTNDKVRLWSKLKTNKGRRQQQLFLIEGVKLVKELLGSPVKPLYLLWDAGTDELPQDLRQQAEDRNITLYELSPAAFAAIADTITPQGVIAIAEIPQQQPQLPQHVLLLDGVQDPGNVGTLLRAADGFEVMEVVCGQGTVHPFAPKVVRASMGGLFRLSVQAIDAITYIEQWQKVWPDGQVLGSSVDAELGCHQVNLQRPSIIAVGNEAKGLSNAVEAACQNTVKVPMAHHTESLNAAMAGSILMYEVYRQGLDR